MNDENAEMLDSEVLGDAESTSQRPALAPAADELKTTRLPPLTPPPPPVQFVTTSLPPIPSAFPPPSKAPSVPDATTRYRSEPPPAVSRPSWLHGLLATTFPPPGIASTPAAGISARRVAGFVCIGLAFVFVLVALISGLRGAPTEFGIAPAVAAAVVIARAIVAIGAGAFSFALIRTAERLLLGEDKAPAPPASSDTSSQS